MTHMYLAISVVQAACRSTATGRCLLADSSLTSRLTRLNPVAILRLQMDSAYTVSVPIGCPAHTMAAPENSPQFSSCRGTTISNGAHLMTCTETATGHANPGLYFKPVLPVSEFATNSTCLLCGMR